MKKLLIVIVMFFSFVSAVNAQCDSLLVAMMADKDTLDAVLMTTSGDVGVMAETFANIKKKLAVSGSDTLKCSDSFTQKTLYERRVFEKYQVELITIWDEDGYVELGYNPVFQYTIEVFTRKGKQPEFDAKNRAKSAMILAQL